MAKKDFLQLNGHTVPLINDARTSEFSEYDTYSRKKIDELVKNGGGGGGETGYDWSGRNVCFEGDSLTANTTMGYPAYVAEKTGCSSTVIGISGRALYPNASGNAWDFRRRVSNIPANTDAIIILGDTNSGAESVYTLEDCAKETPVTLWAARWNLVLDAIKKSFPTVPVILCNSWVGSQTSMKVQQSRYIPIAFDHFANRWGCFRVNLATETPLNLLYSSSVWGLTAADTTHTSHEAMPLFADPIIRKLRQIPPYQWKGYDTLTLASSAEVEVNGKVNLDHTITGDLSIQWVSDRPDIACVLGGTVYGMSAGTANIKATTRNGNTAICQVTVG